MGAGGCERRARFSRWAWERRMRSVIAIASGMVDLPVSDVVSSSSMAIRSISIRELSLKGNWMVSPMHWTP